LAQACEIAIGEVGGFLAGNSSITQVTFACFSEGIEKELRQALRVFQER
jgi:O-acetyl-ADP-ribose deacetylase (regulator of RNase III)